MKNLDLFAPPPDSEQNVGRPSRKGRSTKVRRSTYIDDKAVTALHRRVVIALYNLERINLVPVIDEVLTEYLNAEPGKVAVELENVRSRRSELTKKNREDAVYWVVMQDGLRIDQKKNRRKKAWRLTPLGLQYAKREVTQKPKG